MQEDAAGKNHNCNELFESFKSLPEVISNKICNFYEYTITNMDNTDSIMSIFDSFNVFFAIINIFI